MRLFGVGVSQLGAGFLVTLLLRYRNTVRNCPMSSSLAARGDHPVYDYKVVRQFSVMTVVWGIVGMAVGVLIAVQLVWPGLNEIWAPYTGFGRLWTLLINSAIKAIYGCSLLKSS